RGDLFQLGLAELLLAQRVAQRPGEAVEEILGAREIELEEAIEDRRVLSALHQRRPQGAAEGGAILEADQQRRAGSVRRLRGRDAQAVLAQQRRELFQPVLHGVHGSAVCAPALFLYSKRVPPSREHAEKA